MMSFSSLTFIFMLLPFFLVIYQICPSRLRKYFLIVFSFLFYAWLQPSAVLILITLLCINFYLVKVMDQYSSKRRKQEMLFLVVCNVFSLFYVKYYSFLLSEIKHVIPFLTFKEIENMPIGISFYVFSLLSYVFDVYRHKIKAEQKLSDFALYVAFFPKLLMGPIMRYQDFRKQYVFHRIKKENFEVGMKLFTCGLFQKVVLANSFALIWMMPNKLESAWMAWLAAFAYTFEIYFDFQGYTQMAQGIAAMIGIRLDHNFNRPYRAVSISDFWHRWHMSLSSWFKDYIYIPCGGNRCSKGLQVRNLFIVWMLTGIWHGANWTFVVWGLYYGILLILEKFVFEDRIKELPTWARRSITMLLVMIGWIFFASPTLLDALHYLKTMFTSFHLSYVFLQTLKNSWWLFVVAIWLSNYDLSAILTNLERKPIKSWLQWGIILFVWASILVYSAADTMHAFIYFNF